MAKRKVIEDSDNETSPPSKPSGTGLSDITLSTIVNLDHSSGHQDIQQSANPSTGSTERLNRESRAAHKSLIEHTPNSSGYKIRNYSSSQQPSPVSPFSPCHKSKRAKSSIEDPKVRKPLKTYGRASQDIFDLLGSSDGEFESSTWKKQEKHEFRKAGSDQSFQEVQDIRGLITSSGGDTEAFNSSIKSPMPAADYENAPSYQGAIHPPALKTTSDDQTLRLETGTVPTASIQAPATFTHADHLKVSAESVEEFSSDYRRSAPTILPFNHNEVWQASSTAPTYQDVFNSESETAGPNATTGIEPSPSASEISPSKTITVEKLAQPVMLLPEPKLNDEAQDELSLSVPHPEMTTESQTKSTKRQKQEKSKIGHIDELGSDDHAIGIPKEQYQPRPSKSRSGRGTDEVIIPFDFSKRPEAVAKKKRKAKRHKTTAFHELLPKEDDDEEEEVKIIPNPRYDIPEIGATKPSNQNDEEAKKDEDPLESNQAELEKSRPAVQTNAQKRQRGRPKKGVLGVSDDEDSSDLEATKAPNLITNEHIPELKTATIPNSEKKQQGRPKKGITDLAGDRSADANTDPIESSPEKPVATALGKKAKKRGRANEASLQISDEFVSDEDDDTGAGAASLKPLSNVLEETHGNIVLSKPAEKAKTVTSSPVKLIHSPPETPRKTTELAHKGPDKHSPISNGRVAYRVGLSKRARIEPLLRIVRK